MRSGVALATCALVLVGLLAGCTGSKSGTTNPPPTDTTGPTTSLTPMPSPTATQKPGPAPLPYWPSDGKSNMTYSGIVSFDGHVIPITIYRPLVADAQHQVPILLHSHGFSGSRAKAADAFKPLIAAGFGVVSFDERGHGDAYADSEVKFMDPNYEVKDVRALIDAVATYPWVLLDKPGDPRLGTIGGSYGGAFQLMTSIFDDRIDAMVPEITWNDITDALAPSGAIKSAWVDAFYTTGKTLRTVHFDSDFDAGWTWQAATNTFPAGQAPGVPDLMSRLKLDSPAAYPGRIHPPTLLVQGLPDTLFPLNQAAKNLALLEAANTTSGLYTHLNGHLFNTDSLRPGTSPVPAGLQGPPGGTPCGNMTSLQIRWHTQYVLRRAVEPAPRVCLSLQEGGTLVGQTFPLPGTTTVAYDVPMVVVPQLAAGSPFGFETTLITADTTTVVAGIPHLTGTYTSAAADAIMYVGLRATQNGTTRLLDEQMMPLRITTPSTSPVDFDIEMGGVAVKLQTGETLSVIITNYAEIFGANAERVPGALVLDGMHVELPIALAETPGLPAATPAK